MTSLIALIANSSAMLKELVFSVDIAFPCFHVFSCVGNVLVGLPKLTFWLGWNRTSTVSLYLNWSNEGRCTKH